jgi:hypothetical protein
LTTLHTPGSEGCGCLGGGSLNRVPSWPVSCQPSLKRCQPPCEGGGGVGTSASGLGTTAVSCTGSCHSQDTTCHPASARSRRTCPPPFPPLGLLVTLGDYVYGASALSISDSQMRSVLLPLRYSPELVTPVNRTPSQPSRLFPASATLAYGPTYYLRSVGCHTQWLPHAVAATRSLGTPCNGNDDT